MEYTAISLRRPIQIERIVSVHYFEYGPDFSFTGESHNFWEFVYVDKGEIIAIAGDKEHLVKKGQMIFHAPNEFHSLRATGTRPPSVVVVSFYCECPAMSFFEGRIAGAGDEERDLIASIVRQAGEAFSTPLDDLLVQQLERRENAPFGAEQLIGLALEELLLGMIRRGTQGKTPHPTSLIRERSQNDFWDRVQTYLESNVTRRLTLSDIFNSY